MQKAVGGKAKKKIRTLHIRKRKGHPNGAFPALRVVILPELPVGFFFPLSYFANLGLQLAAAHSRHVTSLSFRQSNLALGRVDPSLGLICRGLIQARKTSEIPGYSAHCARDGVDLANICKSSPLVRV